MGIVAPGGNHDIGVPGAHAGAFGNIVFHQPAHAAAHHDAVAAEVFHDVGADDDVRVHPHDDDAATVNPFDVITLHQNIISTGRIGSAPAHERADINPRAAVAGESAGATKLTPDVVKVTIADHDVAGVTVGAFGEHGDSRAPLTRFGRCAARDFKVKDLPPFLIG